MEEACGRLKDKFGARNLRVLAYSRACYGLPCYRLRSRHDSALTYSQERFGR